MTNQLPLPSDFVYFQNGSREGSGATYDELLQRLPVLRARFDGFELPVIVVQADDEVLIQELFSRLNIQEALNAPERRNAMGGPLPVSIRNVAKIPFFTEAINVVNRRYQHLDLVAKFLYLTRNPGFHSTKKATLDSFVTAYSEAWRNGEDMAGPEGITKLEHKTVTVLNTMHNFFGPSDSLLGSQGRIKLYFHVFRLHEALGVGPTFLREMLELFNVEVEAARLKSQRMSRGSGESLTEQETDLNAFDRDKQSTDDGGALFRQYAIFKRYFSEKFGVDLPSPD